MLPRSSTGPGVTKLAYVLAFVAGGTVSAQTVDYYVKPGGDDHNDGRSIDSALQTLAGARDRIVADERPVSGPPPCTDPVDGRAAICQDIRVNILAGTYAPFSLDGSVTSYQGGSSVHSITYTAYQPTGGPYDDVLISGGVPVSGWFLLDPATNTWAADLPSPLPTFPIRDLYNAGARLTRARYPNADEMIVPPSVETGQVCRGWMRIGYDDEYPPTDPVHCPLTNRHYYGVWGCVPGFNSSPYFPDDQTEMVARAIWWIARGTVHYVRQDCSSPSNPTSFYFTETEPLGVRQYIDSCAGNCPLPSPCATHPWGFLEIATSYAAPPYGMDSFHYAFFENRLEFLDSPNEWFYDTQSGRITLRLPCGCSPLPGQVVYPSEKELLRLYGVLNVHFSHLNFAYSRMDLPVGGFHGGQSGHSFEYSGALGAPDPPPSPSRCVPFLNGQLIVPGALYLHDVFNCEITDCRIAHTGGAALEIDGNTITVQRSEIFDTGGSAIYLGEGCDGAEVHTNNHILNNRISKFGRVYYDCPGIYTGLEKNCVVDHNEVSDGPWTGISFGGGVQAYCDRGANNNEVSFNHIHHVAQLLGDGAGIYTPGRQQLLSGGTPSRMWQNYVHDVVRTDAGLPTRTPLHTGPFGNYEGIAFEQGSVGWNVYQNVVQHCSSPSEGSTSMPIAGSQGGCFPVKIADFINITSNYIDDARFQNLSSITTSSCGPPDCGTTLCSNCGGGAIASFGPPVALQLFDPASPPAAVVDIKNAAGPQGNDLVWMTPSPVIDPTLCCYANCDGSTTAPVLNILDFSCFLQKFALGDPYANCDGSTTAPVLNVLDFSCFLQKFAAGCPCG